MTARWTSEEDRLPEPNAIATGCDRVVADDVRFTERLAARQHEEPLAQERDAGDEVVPED